MAKLLEDRVAIVTGAAAGIGRAAANIFAREGASVVVSDINSAGGEETVEQVLKREGKAIFVKADVSSSEQVQALVAQTVKTFGRLDCAFNNAGIEGQQAAMSEHTEENWDRTIAINLKGVWLCTKYEIDQFLKQGGSGSIVNMASVAGLIGFPGLSPYVASKHGVVGISKTAALEYADKNIRVNTVCPGVIRTEMIDRITGRDPEAEKAFIGYEPLGRMGEPEEVGEAAAWLCSDKASFVTGHAMTVDGGFVAR